jgi:ABC-type glycerol-3-phosphate transport system permease component
LWRAATLWLPLLFFLVFTLGPFWYMLVVSLKDQQLEVNDPSVFPFWPFHPNLNQYIDLFARTQFPRWALNTTLVASVSTLVSLTFGSLAGYALARLRFRGASLLGIITFVTYLVPQTLLFIPLNIVITRLPVSLFLATVIFSTLAVGIPLLLLLIPPENASTGVHWRAGCPQFCYSASGFRWACGVSPRKAQLSAKSTSAAQPTCLIPSGL